MNELEVFKQKCKEEDEAFEALIQEHDRIDKAREGVDEKMQQLKAISGSSAFIFLFSTVMLVEIQIPDGTDKYLLAAFGGGCGLMISVMIVCMTITTFISITIIKFDCVQKEISFEDYWEKNWESHWLFALKLFSYGPPGFIINLNLLGWVVLKDAFTLSAWLATAVGVIGVLFLVLPTEVKWSKILLSSRLQQLLLID